MEIVSGCNDGVVNATPAFQAVLNLPSAGKTIRCFVPRGTYRLDTAPVLGAGNVIWELESGVSFVGNSLSFNSPVKYQGKHVGGGFNTSVVGGAVERTVSKLVLEDSVVMVSTDNYSGSTIFPTDAVLVHHKATNSAATPRAWTVNSNIVKQSTAANNYSCGHEISVQNQTTETGLPNDTGCIMAFFASYIDSGVSGNYGSAAYVIGGTGANASNGWKYGLWVDAITTGGTGINFRTSGTNSMGYGISTMDVTAAFSGGAIGLGNGHKIVSKDNAGVVRNVANLDTSNYLQIGDSAVPIVLNGNGLLVPNLPTATTAGAIQKYGIIAVGGVNYKIPLYAM